MRQRVVLAIDAADRTLHVVREAVDLASALDAELEALLIEDDALLRLASHEFARRFRRTGEELFEPHEIEREWRAIASEVRRALERERIQAELSIVRGAVEAALRARLDRGDVIVVAWGGFSPRPQRAPARVFYDGGEASERALELAVRVAGKRGEVLVWIAPSAEKMHELAQRARAQVGDRVGRLRMAGLEDAQPGTIRRAIADEPGGALLVPADHDLARKLAQRSPAARFPCSVILVHGSAGVAVRRG